MVVGTGVGAGVGNAAKGAAVSARNNGCRVLPLLSGEHPGVNINIAVNKNINLFFKSCSPIRFYGCAIRGRLVNYIIYSFLPLFKYE